MRRSQHGFTLLEILVALSVATLLISLVYGSIRVGHRSALALDRQVEHAESMRIGWQFIHDAVTHAAPSADPARAKSRTGFEGTSDSLVFVARIPDYVGIERTMRVSLRRAAGPGADQLLLTRERMDEKVTPADGAPLEQAVLVDPLDQLRIDYFGRTERGDTPVWHPTWDDPDTLTLPSLIRIKVVPADGATWPVLTAAPQSGTEPLDEDVLSGEAATTDLLDGAAE